MCATGHATFESRPLDRERFDATRLPAHRLVVVEQDADVVRGWAAC